MDPCEQDAEPFELSSGGLGGRTILGDEPKSLDSMLTGSRISIAHMVVRGTYLPDTERCTTGNPYRPPSYLSHEIYDYIEDTLSIRCYVDLRVADYILGDGPSTLTVVRHFYSYRVGAAQAADLEEQLGMSERAFFEDLSQQLEGGEFLGGTVGREEVLLIGPASSLSVEAWQAFRIWDVQKRDDDSVIVVHPHRDLWRSLRPDEYQTHQSKLEMELPAFKQAVAAAHQARVTANGGRILPSNAEGIVEGVELPTLISNVNQLKAYCTAVGSYNHPDGPPAQPSPVPTCANGTVITNPGSNRGLVSDCELLLSAKDALRGTAALNWSADSAITGWDGITTGGTPSRVTKVLLSSKSLSGSIPVSLGSLFELTHLNLSNNSLTGDIPEELGWLYNLEEVRLSGNSLTGCIPVELGEAATNDLSSLNLPYCQPPPPENVMVGTPSETSVVVSWDAVPNTSKYQVEYYNPWLSDWIVDDNTITGTTHTVDDLHCNREHWFQVRAFGSGTTYADVWSEPSIFLPETTGECMSPVFDEAEYTFELAEDASVGDPVGTVSATHPDDDTIIYSITAGNTDNAFAINTNTGAITVAAALDFETTPKYKFAVQAEDEDGDTNTVVVTITATPS